MVTQEVLVTSVTIKRHILLLRPEVKDENQTHYSVNICVNICAKLIRKKNPNASNITDRPLPTSTALFKYKTLKHGKIDKKYGSYLAKVFKDYLN